MVSPPQMRHARPARSAMVGVADPQVPASDAGDALARGRCVAGERGAHDARIVAELLRLRCDRVERGAIARDDAALDVLEHRVAGLRRLESRIALDGVQVAAQRDRHEVPELVRHEDGAHLARGARVGDARTGADRREVIADDVRDDEIAHLVRLERGGETARAPSREALADEIHRRDVESGTVQQFEELHHLFGLERRIGRGDEARGAAGEQHPRIVLGTHSGGGHLDHPRGRERTKPGLRMVADDHLEARVRRGHLSRRDDDATGRLGAVLLEPFHRGDRHRVRGLAHREDPDAATLLFRRDLVERRAQRGRRRRRSDRRPVQLDERRTRIHRRVGCDRPHRLTGSLHERKLTRPIEIRERKNISRRKERASCLVHRASAGDSGIATARNGHVGRCTRHEAR